MSGWHKTKQAHISTIIFAVNDKFGIETHFISDVCQFFIIPPNRFCRWRVNDLEDQILYILQRLFSCLYTLPFFVQCPDQQAIYTTAQRQSLNFFRIGTSSLFVGPPYRHFPQKSNVQIEKAQSSISTNRHSSGRMIYMSLISSIKTRNLKAAPVGTSADFSFEVERSGSHGTLKYLLDK